MCSSLGRAGGVGGLGYIGYYSGVGVQGLGYVGYYSGVGRGGGVWVMYVGYYSGADVIKYNDYIYRNQTMNINIILYITNICVI